MRVLRRLTVAVAGRPGSSLSGTEWVKMPGCSVLALVLVLCLLPPCTGQHHREEAERIMTTTPVIDG